MKFHVNRVINGNGKGGSINDIPKIALSVLSNLRQDDVFLDNATGDIYAFDGINLEFYPVANAGLHYHKAAQEHPHAKEVMLKPKTYKPRIFDEQSLIYPGKVNETTCNIYKQYVQHWLLKGIGVTSTQISDFLIPQQNAWDAHPMNATDSEKIFKVLAESPRGPQILLLDNIVATQFHISSKYPTTVLLIRNYVVQMITKLQTESDKLDIPLAAVTYCVLPARPMLNCSTNQSRCELTCQSPILTNRQNTGMSYRPQTGSSNRPATGISNRPTTSSSIRLHVSVRNTETVRTVTSPNTLRTVVEPKAARPISPARPKSAGICNSGFTFSKRHTEPIIIENNATTDKPIPFKPSGPEREFYKYQTGRISPIQPSISERQYIGPLNIETRGSFDKNGSVLKLKKALSVGNRSTVAIQL